MTPEGCVTLIVYKWNQMDLWSHFYTIRVVGILEMTKFENHCATLTVTDQSLKLVVRQVSF